MGVPGNAPLVLLSLGSNVDAARNLASAARALRERFDEVVFSPLYRTRAVGFDGADFLNAAAALRCDEAPDALQSWLRALEDQHGRRRDVPKFSDRPLDVDIVAVGGIVSPAPLALPRGELVEQAFVLRPCADIAPDYVHPLAGRTLAELSRGHVQAATMQPEAGAEAWVG